jgi:hypothetical protein
LLHAVEQVALHVEQFAKQDLLQFSGESSIDIIFCRLGSIFVNFGLLIAFLV